MHYLIILLVVTAVFALILFWCVRQIAALNRRLDDVVEQLHEWNEVQFGTPPVTFGRPSGVFSYCVKFKNFTKNVRNRNDTP